MSQSKTNLVKEMRQDQLSVVKNSILFHNTQLLTLMIIKIWENWSTRQPAPFHNTCYQATFNTEDPKKQSLKPPILITQLSPKLTLEG